jgi:hypothetical protein
VDENNVAAFSQFYSVLKHFSPTSYKQLELKKRVEAFLKTISFLRRLDAFSSKSMVQIITWCTLGGFQKLELDFFSLIDRVGRGITT